MDRDGGNPHAATFGTQLDSNPTWSPDGTRLAFSRNGDIYEVDPDGGDLQNISSFNTASDGQPDWWGQPDMVVSAIGDPGNVVEGDHVVFTVTVTNQGTAPTPMGVIVDVLFGVDGIDTSWSDQHDASVPIGGSVTLTANGGPDTLGNVPYWVATPGAHVVDAYVNSNVRFAELSRANNHGSRAVTVATAPPPGRDFVPLVPARLLDTRPGGATIDGKFSGSGAVGPGQTLTLTVTGRGGVPASGVGAVALNVTVTEPTTAGFITVWPTGTTRPTASNLNFVAGQTIPNMVIATIGTNGQVSLFNSAGATHLVVDVLGTFPG
jgi:hypothetical protein